MLHEPASPRVTVRRGAHHADYDREAMMRILREQLKLCCQTVMSGSPMTEFQGCSTKLQRTSWTSF